MAQSATVFGDAQLFAARECLFRNGVAYGSGIFWAAAGEDVHLVDAGGKLPIVLTFVDTDEHVGRVLPRIKENGRTAVDCAGECGFGAGKLGITIQNFPESDDLSRAVSIPL